MSAHYLASWLRFDSSTTADKCGNTWTAYGSPTISNNALQLNGSSYVANADIAGDIGNSPWTIHWRAACQRNGQEDFFFGTFNANYGTSGEGTRKWVSVTYNAGNPKLVLFADDTVISANLQLNQSYHYALSYDGTSLRFFIDGVLKLTKTPQPIKLGGAFRIGCTAGRQGSADFFQGSIDEFIILKGVAWTENFTPPTAAEYDALATEYDALTFVTATVQRTITNSTEITCGVERAIKNKPLSWRYYNMGDVHDLTQSATYLTDLPDDKSKTGVAFYQTTRAKCFDLPATHDIWAKFDVYFDGSNRWRAYDGVNTVETGITTESNGALSFFNKDSHVRQQSKVCKANQLQTVLLHMVSGTNGLIEAWVDGNFIYRYNGNVNHGDAFANFYLQSDGAGTFFSNVIISNDEITLGEGYVKFYADVAATIFNPVAEPPSQPHFHFSGTQFAALPLMIAGATTFTLEVKFATTSTINNYYWAKQPTLIGQKANLGYANLFVFVNDGTLGFFSENGVLTTLFETPNSMRGVNSGNVHKMTFSVDNGTIKLTCDGHTCQYSRSAKLHNSNQLLLAWNDFNNESYLTCDIYEARVWSVARADWSDIDGTEEGLECWLKPTPNGLLDYSGNERHAALYGNPAFIGGESFDFPVQRRLVNVVNASFPIERRLIAPTALTANVQRRLTNRVTLNANIERRLSNAYATSFPIERRLIAPTALTANVQRLVINGVTLRANVLRRLNNSYAIDFPILLRLGISCDLVVPVERYISAAYDVSFGVQREILNEGLLPRLLPDSIKNDPKLFASAVALDRQILAVFRDVEQVLHIPRLDKLSGTILDLLAWQFHVDFYEPLYLPDERKRNLIRRSISWHKRKGTVSAVEDLAAATFQGATVEEWFDYGGEPYHFRLIAKSFANNEEDFRIFKRMINVAKNVRSHLDSVNVDYSPNEPLNIFIGLAAFRVGERRHHFDSYSNRDVPLNVGVSVVHIGERRLKFNRLNDWKVTICAGVSRRRSGRIIIGDVPPSKPPPKYFNLPIALFYQRSRCGRLAFKSEPLDDDDPLPDDFVGSYGWFRFFAPTGKRGMKFRNVRDDVTEAELKDFADFVINNQVLLNSKGDPLTGVIRASIARIEEQTIF